MNRSYLVSPCLTPGSTQGPLFGEALGEDRGCPLLPVRGRNRGTMTPGRAGRAWGAAQRNPMRYQPGHHAGGHWSSGGGHLQPKTKRMELSGEERAQGTTPSPRTWAPPALKHSEKKPHAQRGRAEFPRMQQQLSR